MPDTKKSAKPTTGRKTPAKGWTDEEKAAMKEHARELKAAAKRGADEDGEAEVLAKIAEMSKDDREMAERVHELIKANAPDVTVRTWYGMPAYAKDDKVVCFFQPADKFRARYSTLGFNDAAMLDDGAMWPTSWALTKLSKADEAKVGELVKKAWS